MPVTETDTSIRKIDLIEESAPDPVEKTNLTVEQVAAMFSPKKFVLGRDTQGKHACRNDIS